jgi:hypothetical protein
MDWVYVHKMAQKQAFIEYTSMLSIGSEVAVEIEPRSATVEPWRLWTRQMANAGGLLLWRPSEREALGLSIWRTFGAGIIFLNG